MKNLRNNVQLIGRLGNDPELRTFESGKKLTSFSLATNEYYTNKNGEKVTETTWHNIVAWNSVAELVIKHLKKGNEVAIQGKLTNRKYEQDGQTKFVTEISLNEMINLSKNES
ncbi:single-stranded DNA-binding protein [Reichenbachiella versicolor]|uniref:single-stranded DNA-binding protein n=1 Tax=Reichenbachiella versicolor TaxID=1821036 RepID=UPI000D6DCB85|nr:single-stranded DNA-binding protein [Reichenbachiella versicolor]